MYSFKQKNKEGYSNNTLAFEFDDDSRMAEQHEDVPAPSRRVVGLGAEHSFPVVGGLQEGYLVCIHCMCEPCIVDPSVMPSFVRGSASPDRSNVVKRYKLYRKFWSHLRKLGVWDFAVYKARKARLGQRHSARDTLPWCVKMMVRERFPNPDGIPYKDHQWSADV